MILSKQIQNLIQTRFGMQIERPSQFEALSGDIFQQTGDMLGVNTLKRLFGVLPEVRTSQTTLNIIARYLGWDNWMMLQASIDGSNSGFGQDEQVIFAEQLEAYTALHITYSPNRNVELQKQENGLFRVTRCSGGKLQEGDLLAIDCLACGYPFLVKEVWRNGTSLGPYVGGKEGGILQLARY